jgi:putative heme transporter
VSSPAPPPEPSTPALSDTRHDAAESVTWPVRVAAAWSWRLILIAAAAYLMYKAITAVSLVAFALVISLLFCSVLHPLERRLRAALPGPKSLATALTLLIGIAAIGGVGWFVTWQISSHATQLGNQITDFVDHSRTWLQTGPLHLKQADFDKLSQNISNTVRTHQGQLISGAIATVRTLGNVAASILLILLSTFFFLRDGDIIWRWVVSLFPKAAHRRIDHAARLGWRTLSGYMRGVVLIALFHAVSITIVLLILRVPLAPALGVVIFLGSFVPLLGLTVAGALCVVVTAIEHGVTAGIVVAVAIIVLLQIEGHLLQPLIMSRTVQVHPLAIAVTVLSGTALAGIPGALIAVPFVAFVNTTVRGLRSPLDEPVEEAFPVDEFEHHPDEPGSAPPPVDERAVSGEAEERGGDVV